MITCTTNTKTEITFPAHFQHKTEGYIVLAFSLNHGVVVKATVTSGYEEANVSTNWVDFSDKIVWTQVKAQTTFDC